MSGRLVLARPLPPLSTLLGYLGQRRLPAVNRGADGHLVQDRRQYGSQVTGPLAHPHFVPHAR